MHLRRPQRVERRDAAQVLGEERVEGVADARAAAQLGEGGEVAPPVDGGAEVVHVLRDDADEQLAPLVHVLRRRVAQRGELLAGGGHEAGDAIAQHGQARLDVVEQDLVEPLGQEARADQARRRKLRVCRVLEEEVHLVFAGRVDLFVIVDVFLAAVDDADESQLERHNSAVQHLARIRSAIHQVYFCKDAECSITGRIDRF